MSSRNTARNSFNRPAFEALLRRQLFFTSSEPRSHATYFHNARGAEVHGLGLTGCAMQNNIVEVWRKRFVTAEDMMETDCPILTPSSRDQESGHGEAMCRDASTGDYLRADSLVMNVLAERLSRNTGPGGVGLDEETAGYYRRVLSILRGTGWNAHDLGYIIHRFEVRNPNGGGVLEPLSSPHAVSLRRNTLQGQLASFRKLLEHRRSLPFASACAGKVFRNKVSSTTGLVRYAELTVAETEHYFNTESAAHPPLSGDMARSAPLVLCRRLIERGRVDAARLTLRHAIAFGVIANQTVAYFLAKIYLLFKELGADEMGKRVRLRQLLEARMPEHATESWNVELLTSDGWIKCATCTYRAPHDISRIAEGTGTSLEVEAVLHKWVPSLDEGSLCREFGRDAVFVRDAVEALGQKDLEELANELAIDGTVVVRTGGLENGRTVVLLDETMLSIQWLPVPQGRMLTPGVVETSINVTRLQYCLLEQMYWCRHNHPNHEVLSFPITVAPTKVSFLALANDRDSRTRIAVLTEMLRHSGVRSTTLPSLPSRLTTRYALSDEAGIPLCVTLYPVGFHTIRDRDSTEQLQPVSYDEFWEALDNLLRGVETWRVIKTRLPLYDPRGVPVTDRPVEAGVPDDPGD